MEPPSTLSSFSQSFNDIDQFCESLGDWDIEFRQIEPGPGNSKLSVIAAQDNVYQRVQFNNKVQQSGSTPTNAVTFGYIDETNPDLHWCSERGTQSDLMLFPANEWDCVSGAGFVGHTFSLGASTIERVLNQLGDGYADALDVRLPKLINNTMNGSLAPLRRQLDYWFGVIEQQATPIPLPVLDEFAVEIPLQLVAAATNGVSLDAPVMPATRERIRKGARDIIHSRSSQDISVSLICEQLGTSRSTLERSFQGYYGIGPKHYIKLVRLHRLHHQLRRAGPEVTVTQLALDQGLWHMGQLGRDYLYQFGCLPSETLRK